MNLTETQTDLLKEVFNIGVGQAASSLSELAGGDEILLSVPTLEFKDVQTLIDNVRATSGDKVCGISERFGGPFEGEAMMLYSEQESLELVKIMLGETIPVEEMSEMEGEALLEVGNIILNAVISALADLFESEIETEIPVLTTGTCRDVFERTRGFDRSRTVLHLRMDFRLESHCLDGHIGFFMDVASISTLAEHLDVYFQKMLEL